MITLSPEEIPLAIKAINNAEFLSGLDHKLMKRLMEGEYNHYETLNSSKRSSKKIVIEYDIQDN